MEPREVAHVEEQQYTPISRSAYVALFTPMYDSGLLRAAAVNSTYGLYHETWWAADGVPVLYIRKAKDPALDKDEFYVISEVVYEQP